MDANKILYLKELLYDSGKQDVKIAISQMKDQEMLYAFAYNYNWDNGFDIPQEILDNEKCDLSIALLIFYRADGLRSLERKSEYSLRNIEIHNLKEIKKKIAKDRCLLLGSGLNWLQQKKQGDRSRPHSIYLISDHA